MIGKGQAYGVTASACHIQKPLFIAVSSIHVAKVMS